MRWKLIRRRLSISAPRMIIRSHLPWPVRWLAAAVVLGFSGALAMAAFDLGQQLAGFVPDRTKDLARLQEQVAALEAERDRAQSIANAADGLIKAGQVAQERLAQELRQTEEQVQALQADLGFFERLLPTGKGPIQLRSLQVDRQAEGQSRYQLLVMQAGKSPPEFSGSYDIQLAGQLDGKPWKATLPGGPLPLTMHRYKRVEGLFDHPPRLVLQRAMASVTDVKGAVVASETLRLP